MCILLTDTQPLFRRGIINALSINGITEEIIEEDNITEANKALLSRNISIVLMGFHPEREKGYDFVRSIKIFNKNIKVIILTFSTNSQDFIKARELGVEGYLLKDIKIEDLVYAIRVVLRGDTYFSNKLIEKTIMNSEPKELNALTDREKEVFNLMCKGLSNIEIGKNLYITEATTKKHISNIMNKLHLTKRIEAVFYANKLYDNQYIELRG